MSRELPKVYTTEEIAETLQVTLRTVYNYIKDGRMKAVKIGKYWRITEQQLNDFLTAMTKEEEKKDE